MGLFREFLSYVPSGPPPEVPEEELPDPNADRALPDPYRAARRVVMAVCAFCLAWATAQFSTESLRFSAGGVSFDLEDAAFPILLGIALLYFSSRWVLEYAMMPRHVRRWRLAQVDFRIVSVLVRISLMAVAAGALDRSSRSLVTVGAVLASLVGAMAILTIVLMLATMPVRMWARHRAGRVSAANSAFEAFFWASVFAVVVTIALAIGTAAISYWHEPTRELFWRGAPDPIALSVFVLISIVVFLSHWLLKPLYSKLFAERPPYRTERLDDGTVRIRFVGNPNEPIL